jgi:hypothetical protein
MIAPTFVRERLACWPIGDLEFIVESFRRGRLRKWFVLRPHRDVAAQYASRGFRIVVEARTLEPVGVLESDVPPPAHLPAGFNPYFDVPPS